MHEREKKSGIRKGKCMDGEEMRIQIIVKW